MFDTCRVSLLGNIVSLGANREWTLTSRVKPLKLHHDVIINAFCVGKNIGILAFIAPLEDRLGIREFLWVRGTWLEDGFDNSGYLCRPFIINLLPSPYIVLYFRRHFIIYWSRWKISNLVENTRKKKIIKIVPRN